MLSIPLRRLIILRCSSQIGAPCSSPAVVVSVLQAAVGNSSTSFVLHSATPTASLMELFVGGGRACPSSCSAQPLVAASASVQISASFARQPDTFFHTQRSSASSSYHSRGPASAWGSAALFFRFGVRARPSLLNTSTVRFASTSAAAAPPFEPDKIFFKVGDGREYLRFRDATWAALKDMDMGELLEALAGSKIFGNELKDVKLSGCIVAILKGALPADRRVPIAADEAAHNVVMTRGPLALVDTVAEGNCTGNQLFIRVHLPGDAGAPTSGAAFAALDMCATRLTAMRLALRGAPPLLSLATLQLDAASLTPLSAPPPAACKTAAAASPTVPPAVSLAQFHIPGISTEVLIGPKGFEGLMAAGGPLLLEQGRIKLSKEFLRAMIGPIKTNFGVLLSGPNGIGKSAVGVLSFLSCAAQGLPVVYIPRAGEWVEAAIAGKGDAFFLRVFLQQNADLVRRNAELLRAFEPLLRHKDIAGEDLFEVGDVFRDKAASTMESLLTVLKRSSSPHVGVIIDETQKITEAVEKHSLKYFKGGWYGWQNSPGNAFVRMDIASSHGLREFTLVSGERERLRFVRPWARDTVIDFLGAKASPGYISQRVARERVHYICGGVVRSLLEAKAMVAKHGSHPAGLDALESEMREEMAASCAKWMKEVGPAATLQSAASIAKLVRGSTRWVDMKPAYDQGLVALSPTGRRAVAVSSVAASVLHQALAGSIRGNLVALERVREGGERGAALETQLHALMDPCNLLLQTRSLDGSAPSQAVSLHADYSLQFMSASETLPAATTHVLYLPNSGTYPCDAIIVPSASDPTAPVLLLEFSVTHPTDDDRLNKLLGWFRQSPKVEADPPVGATAPLASPLFSEERKRAPEEFGGFIDMVKATHPTQPIVIALCWLGRLKFENAIHIAVTSNAVSTKSTGGGRGASSTANVTINSGIVAPPKKQKLLNAAESAGVAICVLDLPVLERIGVRFMQ